MINDLDVDKKLNEMEEVHLKKDQAMSRERPKGSGYVQKKAKMIMAAPSKFKKIYV